MAVGGVSRRVVRYVEGRPIWEDEGPGFARSQGYGGALVIDASAYRPTRQESALARLAKPETIMARERELDRQLDRQRAQWREHKERSRQRRQEARIHKPGCIRAVNHRADCVLPKPTCDRPMIAGSGLCARLRGHGGPHASRRALDHENERRRARRAA